jgi:protein-serine/threonine kinase
MIYYAMLAKGMLWASAQETDQNYCKYLKKRETGYPQFEMQDPEPKRMLYSLMNPDPNGRPEASDLLEDKWIKSIQMCQCTSSHGSHSSDILVGENVSTHIHLTVPSNVHH